ncbi:MULTISPECIES: ABC transporter ATP-binding protein [Acidiphilium]|uniref:NitT/TauT family transport system ATP-binding protein n=1 Tax=Acidiphilium rubrum TaxID=526 RepID=A0A8G2FLF1_ACIRU|nr:MULTISPECIES: ABC transporter ATP-binding protein [Acidiphilium]SIQ81689.1 NitT/TauT family transport system ATP-binding protein [Acidiphilium rubrum]
MPITLTQVARDFGTIRALDRISLTIEDGSFLTVLGASGCGKSTLLNLIAGLDTPSAGHLAIDGVPITGPGPDRVVVFQQPGLYPWLTLRDNIAFGLRMQGPIDWPRIDDMIGIMGLRGFEAHRPYELSGGMQQRAALARALVMNPRVLLMDEPFAALDAQTRHRMQSFLLELWDQIGATIVFITHDIDEAIMLGDRLVVMQARPGRIAIDQKIPLPRPRHWDMSLEPDYLHLKRNIMAVLAA